VNKTHRAWLVARGGSARYKRQFLQERIEKLAVLKAGPCGDCDGHFPPVAMDFDHVCGEKVHTVSWLLRNSTWEAVIAEVAKCDLVCANCHRIRTANRGESTPHRYRKEA